MGFAASRRLSLGLQVLFGVAENNLGWTTILDYEKSCSRLIDFGKIYLPGCKMCGTTQAVGPKSRFCRGKVLLLELQR